ncbi:S-layer homology domain-containing protein [Paenibacillus sp. sptzw28]|uniref:S-layer homology domain-containing protein n=1 Tax=Paenibacillus sp. sptzw28 TaxID=715179 RepID=UPI001C6E4A1A|nr:S-layer homology domain-containing protein [Paenibacillus sp. sptzw28]QYR21257.1 S-layer homology domain-containing protein [Paenibacillus sp. sptzw28]
MGGSVAISGAAKFGETLTADLSGVTYTPSTSDNVPTYQWYRDGVAITNATGSSYMLTADDMGAAITVTVTSDGTHATGSVTSAATGAVAAADGAAAPAAPVETSKTTTSITLQTVAGQEYSNDGGVTWQDSPTFSGLTPETDYTFVTRVKATATNNASATSAGVTVRTLSSNADLSGLTLSSGNLSPAFTANTTDGYTSSVANSVSSLSLTPTLSDGNATVTASVYNSEGTYGPIDLTNGSAAGSLPLSVGVNTIKVVVTAEDGTTKTYTITVTRASSSNADLNGLTLSSGTLSPAFTAGTTDGYTSSVANSVSSTTVTATVYDSAHATVTASVYNSEGLVTGPITLTSGTASDSLPLSVGINTIKVVVTAQDGTTQTYTVTVTRASSSWTGGSGSMDTGSSTSDNSLSFRVIVNGKEYDQIATGTTTQENGKTVLTATVDPVKLEAQLAKEGDKPTIIVPASAVSADKVTVVLTGEIVKAMENKQAVLEVQTANGSYKLPAAQIAIDHLASQLGSQLKLSDIVIHVVIAKSDTAKVQLAESMGEKGKFTVVVPPVDFTVTASYNGKTVDVDKFNVYVQREIPLPDGIDLSKITTATVLMADGTVYHVPTYITVRDGKYSAVVSSLTNSTYTLIWHPMTFADVANHWSKDAVNDMASRLIVKGVNAEQYNPNAVITRAEFAAIIVRALGLPENGKTVPYGDVKSSDWFVGAVSKAQEYGIIKGYEDGTFRPSKTITRVEALAMIARAMKLTGLDTNVSGVDAVSVLSSFVDGTAVDAWAKQAVAAAVKNGLVKGSEGGLLPKRNITRAETAVIVQRMLIKANLIDNKNSK